MLTSSPKAPPVRQTAGSAQSREEAQEAIEKAERLHAELNELIASRKAQYVEEMQRPFGAGLLAFLRASKPEIVNIFFAFVCVLLAYQIHGMRAGIKKLLAVQEKKEADIAFLRGILSKLSAGDAKPGDVEVGGGNFSKTLARKCAGLVQEMFQESERRVGYSWILGKKLASADSMELQRLVDDLCPLILTEIQSEVGEAAYTPEEVKERRVAALKSEVRTVPRSDGGEGSERSGNDEAAHVGDLMQILEQIHDQDLADGTKQKTDDIERTTATVRRARYAI